MKCRPLCASLVLSVLGGPAAAQQPAPDPLWLRQFGLNDVAVGAATASSAKGGVFVVGSTYAFDCCGWPLPSDAFVASYDEAGNQRWIHQFGTFADDAGTGVASDGEGGAFVVGYVWERNVGAPQVGDFYLARFDEDGNQLWIRYYGTASEEVAYAVAADGAGGAYVAGSTWGSFGSPNAGESDAFLARFDRDGNQIWVRQFGSAAHDWPASVAPDGSGGAFIAGRTQGSLGGPNSGQWDAFLARFDDTGDLLWIKQFGTTAHDFARAVASDGAGGAYIAGSTTGSLGRPNPGANDAFVARCDPTGQLIWIDQFGAGGVDSATSVIGDGAGGAYVAGLTENSLGGPNSGGNDAFLARYNDAGQPLWISQLGTNASDAAHSVSCDGMGGAFIAGGTEGSLGRPRVGQLEAFVARFPRHACYPDCDNNGILDFFDFLCFQNAFLAQDPYADCDRDGTLTFFDFLCFQNEFLAGCP